MRNILTLLIGAIILCCLFSSTKLFSQATTAGLGNNQGAGTDYIGWTSGVGDHLDIKNEDDTCIYFYTNAGANTYLNRKMMIWGRVLNGVEHAALVYNQHK